MTAPRTKSDWQPSDEQAKLKILSDLLCLRIEDIFSELEVGLKFSDRSYNGPCPVHGGKNPRAFSLYPEGDTRPGHWECRTHNCHRVFVPTILGFIRGMLSHQKCSWTAITDKKIGFAEVIAWACKFLGVTLEDVKIDADEVQKRAFAAKVGVLTRGENPERGKSGFDRTIVRKWLNIPSPYFLKRNFSEEVLDKFDVGEYPAVANKPLSERAVVPVYDRGGRLAVGFTGRSVYERCLRCERWHSTSAKCPEEPTAWTAKWLHHGGFSKENLLFNLGKAQESIQKTGTIILVEGPMDVIRLCEAELENAVALFGVSLSDSQQVLLEMAGCLQVVVALDNDEAGELGWQDIEKRLRRSFRLRRVKPIGHDVGEMRVEDLKKLFEGFLKGGTK